MGALYPNNLYQHIGARRDLDLTQDEINQIGDEIQALEAELGQNARGTSGTLAARLTTIETQMSSLFAAAIVQNLRITNDVTTPNSKLVVTADAVSVQGQIVSVNVTIDITATGANGIQSGLTKAGTANSWLYVYVIFNSTSQTVAGFLSNSLTPTLPSGYDKYRRVGAVRNGLGANIGASTSDFGRFLQQDREVVYSWSAQPWLVLNNVASVMTTPTTKGLGASGIGCVPPTSRMALIHARTSSGTAGTAREVRWRVTGSGMGGTQLVSTTTQSTSAVYDTNTAWVTTDSSQQIDIGYDATGGTGQAIWADVQGYYDPI